MLPVYYEFCNPIKILSGQNALENIPYELKNLSASRPLLLSDEMLRKIGILTKLKNAMLSGGSTPAAVFTEIPSDSSIEVINKIASIYRGSGCDSIVALGGGSVIDTAKGVKMVISQDTDDIMKLEGNEILKAGAKVPFVAVPTTAGTGSEATLVAVISNPYANVKMEFISYNLLPDVAVLDVRTTETLPARITASTGLDALCHAVEAYTCKQKNPMSDVYAISSIRLIGQYLTRAVTDGGDCEARISMANASLMAGASFSNSMVGMVHAIGHAMGGVSHIPHGDAMSILLPHCMEFNMEACGTLYGELLLWFAGEDLFVSTPKKERGLKLRECIVSIEEGFNLTCGLPLRLRDTAVKQEHFKEIAYKAMNDGAIVLNPRHVSVDDIIEILKEAY